MKRLVPLLLLAGCHGYLLPFDERPLPAARELACSGGGRVGLDAEGRLVLRPSPGDVAAALGVGLQETDAGLVVTHRLRTDALLEPEDVIVACAAELPPGEPVRRAHREALTGELVGRNALPFPRESPGQIPDQPLAPGAFEAFTPAPPEEPGFLSAGGIAALASAGAVRARATCHEVTSTADLRGYLAGAPWVVLDLVVRRGDREVVVRQPLVEPEEWFPVAEHRPEVGRWHGVAVSRLADWPLERRPAWADADDLVVVRVVRDAPAARAGLRPLDVVPRSEWPRLLEGESVSVRRADGQPKQLPPFPERDAPADLYIPLLLSFEYDGHRTHIGVGPFDFLWHWSSREEYEPETDSYEKTWRWSAGTSIQGAGIREAGGVRETAGVNLFDGARMEFAAELARAREEARRRAGH